jgi:hypothetical protein
MPSFARFSAKPQAFHPTTGKCRVAANGLPEVLPVPTGLARQKGETKTQGK